MLGRLRLKGAAINDGLAFGVLNDTVADGFSAFSGCRSDASPRWCGGEKRRSTSIPYCWARERPFDALATPRNGHHLLARIADKLPSPSRPGDPESVSKLLNLASRFRSVDCSRKTLGPINLDRVEAAPLPSGRRVMLAITTWV